MATLLMWTGFNLVSRLGGKSVLTPYDIFALRLITASIVLLPFATSTVSYTHLRAHETDS